MLTEENIKGMITDLYDLINCHIDDDLQAECYGYGESEWSWIFGELNITVKYGWTCKYYEEPENRIDGMVEYYAYTEADRATIKTSLVWIIARDENLDIVNIPVDELKQIFDVVNL